MKIRYRILEWQTIKKWAKTYETNRELGNDYRKMYEGHFLSSGNSCIFLKLHKLQTLYEYLLKIWPFSDHFMEILIW